MLRKMRWISGGRDLPQKNVGFLEYSYKVVDVVDVFELPIAPYMGLIHGDILLMYMVL